MVYVTKSGVRLEIGRIPRRLIDEFVRDHPVPEPPMKQVEAEVFGGIKEEMPDTKDPEYLLEMRRYYLEVGYKQIDLIAPAVKILDEIGTAEELEFIGLSDNPADLLRSVVFDNQDDLTNVVEEVFYQSTVTQRGIEEAAKMFGVTWHGMPVDLTKGPKSPAMYGSQFGDRKAAKEGGYNWREFIELSGPEQSAVVAHHRLSNRLDWLLAHTK
jgi:hypothetical protein